MSRRELVCPECETPARPVLIEPAPEMYTCETCELTYPRKLLKQRDVLHRQIAGVGGGLAPQMEFLGSAVSESAVGSNLSISGLKIGVGERLYFAYLTDYPIGFVSAISATWGSEQVGANPWVPDTVTREASADTDGNTQLWVGSYNPIAPGTRSFAISEDGNVPDHRILMAFRVLNAKTNLSGDESEREENFDPPLILGPISSTQGAEAWACAVGVRSTGTGTWTGATLLRTVVGGVMHLSVAIDRGSLASASYVGFTSGNSCGSLLGYRRA